MPQSGIHATEVRNGWLQEIVWVYPTMFKLITTAISLLRLSTGTTRYFFEIDLLKLVKSWEKAKHVNLCDSLPLAWGG